MFKTLKQKYFTCIIHICIHTNYYYDYVDILKPLNTLHYSYVCYISFSKKTCAYSHLKISFKRRIL